MYIYPVMEIKIQFKENGEVSLMLSFGLLLVDILGFDSAQPSEGAVDVLDFDSASHRIILAHPLILYPELFPELFPERRRWASWFKPRSWPILPSLPSCFKIPHLNSKKNRAIITNRPALFCFLVLKLFF